MASTRSDFESTRFEDGIRDLVNVISFSLFSACAERVVRLMRTRSPPLQGVRKYLHLQRRHLAPLLGKLERVLKPCALLDHFDSVVESADASCHSNVSFEANVDPHFKVVWRAR